MRGLKNFPEASLLGPQRPNRRGLAHRPGDCGQFWSCFFRCLLCLQKRSVTPSHRVKTPPYCELVVLVPLRCKSVCFSVLGRFRFWDMARESAFLESKVSCNFPTGERRSVRMNRLRGSKNPSFCRKRKCRKQRMPRPEWFSFFVRLIFCSTNEKS